MTHNTDLVYSTNPELNKPCAHCKKTLSSCTCSQKSSSIELSKITALVRLEKKHRGGKDVTVIERLPASEDFLKDLSQNLKKKCGCGGTFKITDGTGIVEVQGDKRDQIKSELSKLGIKTR
jgi:translation initiation factor 1